ncbi:MAG: hypothetical protein NUK63_06860 [Candidatus Bathyarchaeum tardum]|nr:MAG: hypothetical protein NUK63_06860 [Candidatus Bathyarchaeum tardum]
MTEIKLKLKLSKWKKKLSTSKDENDQGREEDISSSYVPVKTIVC